MIKFSVKSFLISLKWIFIPLLIIAICLVPACIYFIIATKGQLNSMSEGITSELGAVSCDIEALINSIFNAAKALPWRTPAKALNMIFKDDWLSTVINDFLEETNGSAYTAAMQGNVKSTAAAIQNNLSVFPIAIIAGMILAYFFTASFLRKKYCPRSIWKTILNVLLDLLLTSTLVVFVAYLCGLFVESLFFTSIITALVYGFISLIEAYFCHKDDKMKLRDVINAKVIVQLLVSYLLILVLAVLIIILLFLIPMKLISVVLALPVIIIAFINYNLAAESYVRSLRKDYKEVK